ncbi:MAG: molybdopterin-synthase adenylyltransferase MoeB [Pseudomonadales bacterium]|nr:molybdopterin-synthase adenylyltransferase MoeB [Pseudomonadales bacterium]
MNDEQLLRYNRQLLLHDFDVAGQEALLRAAVLVVGLGGLGCPAALYLAAAGVGRLLLADGDSVEASNLQRQIAHGDKDIGRNKAASAADAIAALNPGVTVEVIARELFEDDLPALVQRVDLVVDATDNFPVRHALNRACIAAAVPLVSAAAVRSEGQLSVFDPVRGGPCYRCLYPDTADVTALSCSESGVLAPLVGVLGSLQAMEALKILAGYGKPLRGELLLLDLRSVDIRRLALSPRADCPDCSHLQR